jgi:hypothetical protein
VILEAMACGVPVAAFPVPGPADLITDGGTGALDEDLREAVFRALSIDSEACVEFAGRYSWSRCTQRFLSLLQPIIDERPTTPNAHTPTRGADQAAYNSQGCQLPHQARKARSIAQPS